jgi:hypothetical protein
MRSSRGVPWPGLQLLHCTLRSVERDGDIPDAATFDEPHVNDLALCFREAIDELEQTHASFQILVFAFVRHVGQRVVRVARLAAPMIGQRIRGNTTQPGGKRCAAPLKRRQLRQPLLEDGGRDVFSRGAAPGPPADIRVYAVDMAVVQLQKPRRICLRRLDQRPLVVDAGFHAYPVHPSMTVTDDGVRKLRESEPDSERVSVEAIKSTPFEAQRSLVTFSCARPLRSSA